MSDSSDDQSDFEGFTAEDLGDGLESNNESDISTSSSDDDEDYRSTDILDPK